MRARHADVIDWCKLNKATLKQVRKEKLKAEHSFLAYFNSAKEFIDDYREGARKRKSGEAAAESTQPSPENVAIYQQAASQDLLRRMKWKRATWDTDADFNVFSRRIINNEDLFKHVPAFSFLTIKVVKDPFTVAATQQSDEMSNFKAGDITTWLTTERTVNRRPPFEPPRVSSPPFSVDWAHGEVKFLDSATANEVLMFIRTVAPQLQAAQIRLEEQQNKINEDMENARVRLGAVRFKYNDHEEATREIAAEAKHFNANSYVSPAQVRQFLDGVLAGATSYRWYLGGQEIRITHPSQPYRINVEKNEVQIPSNFADFNWLPIHQRATLFEKIFNAFRTTWYIWFLVGTMIVGDLELF